MTDLQKTANFNVKINVTEERAKEIKEETGLSTQEYFDILIRDHLKSLTPEEDQLVIE